MVRCMRFYICCSPISPRPPTQTVTNLAMAAGVSVPSCIKHTVLVGTYDAAVALKRNIWCPSMHSNVSGLGQALVGSGGLQHPVVTDNLQGKATCTSSSCASLVWCWLLYFWPGRICDYGNASSVLAPYPVLKPSLQDGQPSNSFQHSQVIACLLLARQKWFPPSHNKPCSGHRSKCTMHCVHQWLGTSVES